MQPRIKFFRIHNFMGVQEAEIIGSDVVQITGPNGVGKTSIVKALQSVLKGSGHDHELLHIGERNGEIYVVMDDETEITKKIGEHQSPILIRNPHGRVSRTRDWLNATFDLMAYNPVELILSNKSRRRELLVEALGEKVSLDDLREGIGDLFDMTTVEVIDGVVTFERTNDLEMATAAVSVHASGLKVLNSFIEYLEPWRRKVGQDSRSKRDSAKELRDTLPPDLHEIQTPEELRTESRELTDKLTSISQRESVSLEQARKEHEDESVIRKGTLNKELDEVRAELAMIEEKKRNLEKRQSELNTSLYELTSDLDKQFGLKKAKIKSDFSGEKALIGQKQSEINREIEQAGRRQQTIDSIDRYDREHEVLDVRYKRLDHAVLFLREHQNKLLGSLNIPNVTIAEDGEIVVDSVRFDKLNTATQMKVAFSVLGLRGGKVAIIDGAERLDDNSKAHLFAEAEANGIQLIMTEVTGQELEVHSESYGEAKGRLELFDPLTT